jgi:hypothetical protein
VASPLARHLNVAPLYELADRFAALREDADQETAATLTEVALYLERETAIGIPVDRGFLRSGLTSGIESTAPHMATAFVGVQGLAASYAAAIEDGARPHWPPLAALEGWVRRKGLNWTDKKGRAMSVRSIAYLIARKIATRGFAGVHMAREAVERGDAEINAIVERRFHEFVDRHF